MATLVRSAKAAQKKTASRKVTPRVIAKGKLSYAELAALAKRKKPSKIVV